MKKLIKSLSIFVLTGILVLMAFNFVLMPLYINARNIVVIPDLEGLTLEEANQLSKSEGIEVVVADTIFTNDLNPNIVLEQFPSSGKEVKLGRSIKVKITQFNQKIVVPSLLGKTLRAAEIQLDQEGIELDSIYYSFSSKYPKGIVSWQSPTENDSIRKGFGVRIEVSNGLAPNDLVDVPDFQGIFLNEALKIIQEKGFFEGKIQYIENKKFLPNTVLNQSHKDGTKVSQGSKINLVIVK
jgi:beta-lactam-binding protein with PASTA domain